MPWGSIVFGYFYNSIAAGVQFAPLVGRAFVLFWSGMGTVVFIGALVLQEIFRAMGKHYLGKGSSRRHRIKYRARRR